MAVFEVYNEAGVGFNMPSSAASGWIINSSNEVFDLTYDDGSTAFYDVYGSPIYDSVAIDYNISGGIVTIYNIEYATGPYVALEILGINLQVLTSDLVNGKVWLIELNTGDDHFGGNDFIDIIYAGPGNDEVFGWGANDFLSGDSGNDYLDGMSGNDVLSGRRGFDFLGDKIGKDKLYGGADPDQFYFGKGYKKDTIKDLNSSEDTVLIKKNLAKNFNDIREVADNYKGGVALEFSNKDVLKIEDFKAYHLNLIDFDFV